MLATRLDLCYAVGVLGRHAARPDNLHWAAVIRVLAYVKGTLDFGLEFQPDDSPLADFEAYSDSNLGACPLTSRSTMGYTFFYNCTQHLCLMENLVSEQLHPGNVTVT
ncbi:hypothetical protein JCM3774_005813 [Rhodotorula dairenensis]